MLKKMRRSGRKQYLFSVFEEGKIARTEIDSQDGVKSGQLLGEDQHRQTAFVLDLIVFFTQTRADVGGVIHSRPPQHR